MRNALFSVISVCWLISLSGCGGCRQDTKETAKDLTKATVGISKEILSGVKDGIDEGRKSTEGIDGAVVVSTYDEVAKYLDVSILSVQAPKDAETGNNVEIAIAFVNKHTKPVRLANLKQKGSLVLLDKDGFASHLNPGSSNEDEITILPGLKERFTYVFTGNEKTAKRLRLYGHDYDLMPQ